MPKAYASLVREQQRCLTNFRIRLRSCFCNLIDRHMPPSQATMPTSQATVPPSQAKVPTSLAGAEHHHRQTLMPQCAAGDAASAQSSGDGTAPYWTPRHSSASGGGNCAPTSKVCLIPVQFSPSVCMLPYTTSRTSSCSRSASLHSRKGICRNIRGTAIRS